jgi:hypothetical protein
MKHGGIEFGIVEGSWGDDGMNTWNIRSGFPR